MKLKQLLTGVFTFAVTALVWPVAQASNDVVITPLGSDEGEFCQRDRAIILEDPSGVRILIQPGRTVDGSTDERLGDIHAILLDHAHDDHVGDRIEIGTDAEGCDPQREALSEAITPNIAAIAKAKNSAVLVGGELVPWLRNRIGTGGCGSTSGLTNLTQVLRNSACVDTLRPGASRELLLGNKATGVRVSTVQATHSNGISSAFVDGVLAAGTSAYGGTETGYVIRFSNGLSVYWSGDSGFFGDMELFSGFYGVNMTIIHMGDLFTMGPDEAAFAVNTLIRPRTAIAAHANEAATLGGKVRAGTRTERFIKRVNRNTRVIVPLSGVKIRCKGSGHCRQDKSSDD